MKSMIKQTLVMTLVLGSVKAMALQVVGGVLISVTALPVTTLGSASYSSSKNAGTFPEAVKAGDKTINDMEKFIGVKLSREVLIGARAEAQTFLATEDSAANLGPNYPMLTAAIDEAAAQAEKQGMVVNPHSVAEVIANYTE